MPSGREAGVPEKKAYVLLLWWNDVAKGNSKLKVRPTAEAYKPQHHSVIKRDIVWLQGIDTTYDLRSVAGKELDLFEGALFSNTE